MNDRRGERAEEGPGLRSDLYLGILEMMTGVSVAGDDPGPLSDHPSLPFLSVLTWTH